MEREVDQATAAEQRALATRSEAARRVAEAQARLDSLAGADKH